ncbi:lactonase family protein, partial [bacterium]|nr:lactonase family protein [bacterium]
QEPVAGAYSIDVKTGMLSFLNRQRIPEGGTCHINVDKTGKCVLTANYSRGNVSMFPVLADGGLDEMSDLVQHTGSGPNEKRQKAAHAHSINISLDNKYAYAADLGIDKVMIYKLDLEKGKLLPNEPPFAKVAPGAGPRHLDFHPNGQFAYVINELNATVTAFTYNRSDGSLTEIQTVPTLPDDFSGNNTTADIHVSPCGKFLYGSNRGHDSIAIFSVDTDTGMLSPIGHEPTQGSEPRNFAVDPTGRYLLAENHRSDTIVIFRIDKATGKLIPTGNVVEVPSPVCIKMIPVGG